MRILVYCSYCGTNYIGWEKQKEGKTIQGEIEAVLSKFFNRQISIFASGRTDAGVHAVRQTFHFDIIETSVDLNKMKYNCNLMLPKDIKLHKAIKVKDDFNARLSAKYKTYKYIIYCEDKNVFQNNLSYVCPYKISTIKLMRALTHFYGTHNFQNFTSKETDETNFVRTIYRIRVNRIGKRIEITITGNGFMRYMIRYIIGYSIEVALGKQTMESIKNLLNRSNRKIVSTKAPAQGLYLYKVFY